MNSPLVGAALFEGHVSAEVKDDSVSEICPVKVMAWAISQEGWRYCDSANASILSSCELPHAQLLCIAKVMS